MPLSRCFGHPLDIILVYLPLFLFLQPGNAADMTPVRQLRFERFGAEDGLSQNSVMCMIQGSNGFLWFGTQEGLNRYDGYDFKVFKSDREDPNAISDNFIRCLFEDRNGVLWVGTRNGGVNRFDIGKKSFSTYDIADDSVRSLNHKEIWCIFEDSRNNLWFGTNGGGLMRLDRSSNKFNFFFHDENDPTSISSNKVKVIFEDSGNNLWIGTDGGGLCLFDRDSGRFDSYRSSDQSGSISSDKVFSIFEDSRRNLWVGTNGGGVNLFDRELGTFSVYRNDEQPDSLSNDVVKCIVETSKGELFIGTVDGLNQFDYEEQKFFRSYFNQANEFSLSGNRVWSIYEDFSNVLWIGTHNGLNRINHSAATFGLHNHDPLDSFSLKSNSIHSFAADHRDRIWVSTDKGVQLLGSPRAQLSLSEAAALNFFEKVESDGFLFYDRKEILWFGFKTGLIAWNTKNNILLNSADGSSPPSLGNSWVSKISEDPDGNLWIGTFRDGIHFLDRAVNDKFFTGNGNLKVEKFSHSRKDPNSLSDNNVTSVLSTQPGFVIIATLRGGLNIFDIQSKEFTRLYHEPNNSHSIIDDSVLSLFQDSKAVVWVGTSQGLSKLDGPKPGTIQYRFTNYGEKDGLPSGVINGILGDKNGHIWLSTNKGISQFDPNGETFKNYGVRDGLQGNEFHTGSYYQSPDGQFFFGGVNGFNAFYPEDIKDDPHKPPLVVTDFLIFNKPVLLKREDPRSPLEKTIFETEELNLSYKDSVFSFKFAALHYAIPEKNSYAYKMENFHDDWIETGADNRMATFTNLDPGDYVFRVKGSNKDGIWNEEGVSLNIHIEAPPWATWWAYTLYLLTVTVIMIWYVRVQKSRLEQERSVSNRLRELDRMKDEFLANTSHELRTPLNGIIGLTESIVAGAAGKLNDKLKTDLSLVVASGKRLAHLVNEILDFAKLKHQGMVLRKKPVDMSSITEVVLTLSTPLIGFKDIKVFNEISNDLPPVEADEDRLQQILFNLIGNAIKFTERGEIKITARENHGQISVEVSDTGIGIRKEDLGRIFTSFEQVEGNTTRQFSGTGIGLALTRQLVLLHGGMIHVESNIGQGSTFSFTLPMADKNAIIPEPDPQPVARLRAEAQVLTENTFFPDSPLSMSEAQIVTSNAASEDLDYDPDGFLVLIVDDEPVNCRVLNNYLTLEKYRILQAESGFQALDIIESGQSVDLVLLDVMMPRMSGYEVCRKLREKYTVHELPIIFLTAKDQVSDLVTGFALGANDFVTKPISRNELLSRVKTHLQLLDANRNLEEKVEARTGELKQKNEEILMTQQQLVMQEKMASLGILTAGVAHEINNPTNFAHVSAQNMEVDLEAFRAFLMELAEDAGDTLLDTFNNKFGLLSGHLSTVLEGTNRIKQIVRDLRVFSRLDESESKPVRIADSLQSTLNLVKTKYRETTDFVCNFKENPELLCWPAQLNQVFMNIIVNACQAIQSKKVKEGLTGPGQLLITTDVEEPWVVIAFKDSGCGIPDDVRDKIFEPFFTTKDVGEGTGLGLSISYGIIQKHKGRMEVASVSGEGTTFTLYLPLTNEGRQEDN